MESVAHLLVVILLWLVHAMLANGAEDDLKIFVRFKEAFRVCVGVVNALVCFSIAFSSFCDVCVGRSFLGLCGG